VGGHDPGAAAAQAAGTGQEQEDLAHKKPPHHKAFAGSAEYPTLFISGQVAKMTGQEARHILDRGFNKKYYLDLIVALVDEHGPVSREKIDEMLITKLPEVLAEKQKKSKVHNLLTELSSKGLIRNSGSRGHPQWVTGNKLSSS
jgi:hypothetical protein